MTTNLSARTWPVWARTGDEWRPLEQSPRPVPIGNEVPHSGPSGRRLRAGELPPHLVGLERTQQPASIARNCDSRRRELAAGAQSSQSEVAPAGRGGRGPVSATRARAVISHSPHLNHGQTMRVHAGYTRGSTTAPANPTWPTVESPVSQWFQQRPTTALHGSMRPLKAVARVRIPSGLPSRRCEPERATAGGRAPRPRGHSSRRCAALAQACSSRPVPARRAVRPQSFAGRLGVAGRGRGPADLRISLDAARTVGTDG
jgi:hypothetical protein